MTVEVGFIIAGVSCLCGALGYLSGKQKDSKQDGQQQGQIQTDIKYIKDGIDDIKKTVQDHDLKIWDLAKQMADVQASTKSAHHRLDQIGKGG